ncbi:MAG: hypothetical protein HRT43_08855 [Campylobacteraceae bacterium]|nr:hypothetical protein [Campylobacteraceae bacterium]
MKQQVNNKFEAVLNSDFIIVFGTLLNQTNEVLTSSVKHAMKLNNAHVVYMHPIDDKKIKNFSSLYIKYEVGSEEGICALLLEYFANDCDGVVQEFIEDLDLGYLSAESSVGEEEFEQMVELSFNKTKKTLVLSNDLFTHEKIENISKLLGALNKFSELTIVLDPEIDDKYKEYINMIENYENDILEEVDEITAYDGMVMYNYASNNSNILMGGASFARVAKIKDQDEITIHYGNKNIRSVFVQDLNLQGTIALNLLNEEALKNNVWINEGYTYKRVNIERLMHNE